MTAHLNVSYAYRSTSESSFDGYVSLEVSQTHPGELATYEESLDRAVEVAEKLDARQTFPDVTAEVFFGGPCDIRFHEFRMFGNVGVWYTDLLYDVTVLRDVTYNHS